MLKYAYSMSANGRIRDFVKHLLLARMGDGRWEMGMLSFFFVFFFFTYVAS